MRVGEMNSDQLSECLPDLAICIGNIMEDAEVGEALGRLARKSVDAKTVAAKWGCIIHEIVPVAFRRHKDDIFKIMSVLSEKSVDEIKAQNGIATIKEAIGLVDNELMSFFNLAGGTENNP